MKMRLLGVMIMAMAFAMYAAAQGGYGGSAGSAGSQQTSPSASPSGATPAGGSVGQDTSTAATPNADNKAKTGKTLQGCIRSESGKYMLEEKGGKMAALDSTSDLSAHVGHMVKVNGDWQKSSSATSSTDTGKSSASAGGTSPGASSTSPSASGGATPAGSNLPASDQPSSSGMKMDHEGKTFTVSNVEMVSATCEMKK
jgi:hypothetical protein